MRHTIKPHDVLQGVQVLDISLVTAEDLGSGTEIIGKVLSILLPHLSITTQGIDLLVEGNIVGWPVTCSSAKDKFLKCPIETNMVENRKKDVLLPMRRACVWSEYSTNPGICSTTVRAPSSTLWPSFTLLLSNTIYWLLYVPRRVGGGSWWIEEKRRKGKKVCKMI